MPDTTAMFAVAASKTAWTDPTVQVHKAGCPHAAQRSRDGFYVGTYPSHARAVEAAADAARTVGCRSVTWMDCTLLGESSARSAEQQSQS